MEKKVVLLKSSEAGFGLPEVTEKLNQCSRTYLLMHVSSLVSRVLHNYIIAYSSNQNSYVNHMNNRIYKRHKYLKRLSVD